MDWQWCHAALPGPVIHSRQTNGAGQDDCNGYPSQNLSHKWVGLFQQNQLNRNSSEIWLHSYEHIKQITKQKLSPTLTRHGLVGHSCWWLCLNLSRWWLYHTLSWLEHINDSSRCWLNTLLRDGAVLMSTISLTHYFISPFPSLSSPQTLENPLFDEFHTMM